MGEIIAKTLFGLENILAEELKQLNAKGIKLYNRAVGFEGDKKTVYKANYCLRTALKILLPIGEAVINNEAELYQYIRTIKWENYLGVNDTLAVEVSLSTNIFKHSHFIAQKIKDGIVDHFRDKYGTRPSVDLKNPVLRINALIQNNIVKLSRDSSGDSLHRRGYRVKQGPAPINEVLAAGLIKLSGWNEKDPLIDFMCGSGTIPVEAALMASRIYPGDLGKEYGFQKWKDYDRQMFKEAIKETKTDILKGTVNVFASDISAEVIALARKHAQIAGVSDRIRFSISDFQHVTPPPPPGVVIVNPPYGERIVQDELNTLYSNMGNKFKKDFAGYNAWVISANAEAFKFVGLKPSLKIQTFNGQLECRFNKYSMYDGSKKPHKIMNS